MSLSYGHSSYGNGVASSTKRDRKSQSQHHSQNGQRGGSAGSRSSAGRKPSTNPVEQKEREVLNVVNTLCHELSKDGGRKVVWFERDDGYCAGHLLKRSSSPQRSLVKTMFNDYVIVTQHYNKVPSNITPANILQFVRRLDNMCPEFETRVTAQVTYTGLFRNTTAMETFTVKDWGFLYSERSVRVYSSSFPKEYKIMPVDALQCHMLSGNSSDTQAEVTDIRQRLQACLDQNEQLQRANEDQKTDLENLRKTYGKARDRIGTLKRESDEKGSQISGLEQTVQEIRAGAERNSRTLKEKNTTLLREKREAEKKVSALRAQITQKDRRIIGLEKSEAANRVNLEQSEQTIQQLNADIAKKSESNRAFAEQQKIMKLEIQELRNDVSTQQETIHDLERNERVYEQQLRSLAFEREKTASLTQQVSDLTGQLSEYKGGSLVSVFSGVNFASELSDLRDQQHDGAFEVCDEMGLTSEESYDLLWRMFMVAYGYFEDKMAQIRALLNINGKKELDTLFLVKMQDNYKRLFDGEGVQRAYVEAFSTELGERVGERRLVEYVDRCGFLCWCVVLHGDPKLHFMPRDNAIDPDEDLMFDAGKFLDFGATLRRGAAGIVTNFVLPGLYRVDSNVAIAPNAMPSVVVKKLRKRKSGAEKPKQDGVSARRELANKEKIEADIWDGNVEPAAQALIRGGVNLKRDLVVIRCAVEGCDAILASSFSEFKQIIENDEVLNCPRDYMHQGAKISVQRPARLA